MRQLYSEQTHLIQHTHAHTHMHTYTSHIHITQTPTHQHNDISSCSYQSIKSGLVFFVCAHTGPHQELVPFIFGGPWKRSVLLQVSASHERCELIVVIDDGKFTCVRRGGGREGGGREGGRRGGGKEGGREGRREEGRKEGGEGRGKNYQEVNIEGWSK